MSCSMSHYKNNIVVSSHHFNPTQPAHTLATLNYSLCLQIVEILS